MENTFTRLRDYFQSITDSLANIKDGSKIFPNSSDKGISREDVFKDFLEKHLPKRCEVVKGGFIFDSDGNASKQIDLIVTNDLTLQFKQFSKGQSNGKSFNCIEGVVATISIKTFLNKDELIDSLDNFTSIPLMPNMENKINPLLKGKEKFNELPFKTLFSFDGLEKGTILQHLNNYYSNTKIPENRKVDLIIVNNEYVIVKIGEKGGETRNGTKIEPFSYYAFSGDYIGAWSLIYLLTRIQESSIFGSQLLIDFKEYLDKTPF